MSDCQTRYRIGVLASSDSWYFKDLQRVACDCELFCLPFEQLSSCLTQQGIQYSCGAENLEELNAIIVRTMPPGSLEQVVFRMDVLERYRAQGGIVLNAPKALECAVDKYLTTTKLIAAGVPSPRTIVCQTAEQAMEAFFTLGEHVVVKPLFGSEGRGILKVSDSALASRVFRTLEQLQAILYLQEYVNHPGFDIRIFLIGESTYAMKRLNPHDWRTNVSRGARTEVFEASAELIAMAKQAASIVGAEIVGVDLITDLQGNWFVLEVNAVPGWKALAQTLQVDIAAEVLQYTIQKIQERAT
jgi:RimK family alpha-L-glutamate ligase